MQALTEPLYRRLYEACNYRLRSFAGGRWAGHCRPTSVIILVTERCNARCVHCDIWKNKGKEDVPSGDQLRTVLSDLRQWLGPVHVAFSGGEALLAKDSIELIRHASSLGLFTEVLSHGYWDEYAKIEALVLTQPSRVTVSLDGIGETHSRIRGRTDFWTKTNSFIESVQAIRQQKKLKFEIRLKTVVMSHNLDDICRVADYATQPDMHVFYQPIEQNYNTVEDPQWYEKTDNWPRETDKVVGIIKQLIALKRRGSHIDNSYSQLEAMIPYFRNPDSLRVTTQSHSAHERRTLCAALTMLQLQANGDVTICSGADPVGNVKNESVRSIWENRPRWWEAGCCMERRLSQAERKARSLPVLS
jgi:MoaA/NifB/PqqE/SkfB family radical SAM enzyme